MKTRLIRGVVLALGMAGLSAQTKSISIFNVDVFDGYRMLRGQTVTFQGGMIRGVEQSRGKAAAAAESIDGKGKTLLPGLIDAHVHISREESLEQAAAFGVTTELDMFGDPKALMPLRKELRRGDHPNAADFLTAGTGVTVPGGHPTELGGPPFATLKSSDNVQAFVNARFAEGSDYLKILYEHSMPTLSEDQLRALIAAAHKRGKLAVVHESKEFEGLAAMRAGADGIEHIFDDTPVSREFIETAVANHSIFTPTLSVIQAFGGAPSGPALSKDPRFEPYLLGWAIDILNVKLPATVAQRHHFESALGAVRALHEAGVTILAGTDAPNPDTGYGVSLHQELQLLTECGLTPEQAMHAATAAPAREFGLIDRGRIQNGRRADLLLVKGDPSRDIRDTRNIAAVWKEGIRIRRDEVAKGAKASRK
ncbi:MAG: amidohydrolase family protein [Acidobacteriota bacterium]|nr:amidohydrolase family protein [Acidobacteriota bacterium]